MEHNNTKEDEKWKCVGQSVSGTTTNMKKQLKGGNVYVDAPVIQGGSVPTEPTAADNPILQEKAQMKSELLTMTLDDNDTSDYMKLIKAREDTCDDDDYQPLLTRDSPSDDHEPDYDYTSSLENIYQPLLMENVKGSKGSCDSVYQALFSGPHQQH